jgi:hypothetical protein
MDTPKQTAERIVDIILKSLGNEKEPMRPLLVAYIEKEIEEFYNNHFR